MVQVSVGIDCSVIPPRKQISEGRNVVSGRQFICTPSLFKLMYCMSRVHVDYSCASTSGSATQPQMDEYICTVYSVWNKTITKWDPLINALAIKLCNITAFVDLGKRIWRSGVLRRKTSRSHKGGRTTGWIDGHRCTLSSSTPNVWEVLPLNLLFLWVRA